MTFDEAFEALIGHEGGLSLDRADRGNWTTGIIGNGELHGTKFGVSAMAYPNVDIKSLTLDKAKSIYLADYWNKAGCDRVPAPVAFDLFDAAVNSGNVQAVKWLQAAAMCTEDGQFGPKTLIAVAASDPDRLSARLNGYRLEFMADLPTWSTFGKGWARRIASNLTRTRL